MSNIYLLFAGIISHAIPALAKDRIAQDAIRVRNPKTNAWEIALRIRAAVAESRPEGRSRSGNPLGRCPVTTIGPNEEG